MLDEAERAREEAERVIGQLTEMMDDVKTITEEALWEEPIEKIRQVLADHEWSLGPDDIDTFATISHSLDVAMWTWINMMSVAFERTSDARWGVLEKYWTADDGDD